MIVDLALGQATGDGADSLAEIENVLGSEFNDRLSGGSGGNVLSGAGGKDVIAGRRGSDRLDGGAGNDVLTGGKQSDGSTAAPAATSSMREMVCATTCSAEPAVMSLESTGGRPRR